MNSPLTSGSDLVRDWIGRAGCLCSVGTLPTDPVLSLRVKALPTWVLGDASSTEERSDSAELKVRG